MRAAIYTRVSSAAQSDDGTSLITQETACRAEVQARGWEVDETHVYREVRTGAELFERPELSRLRDGMRHHAFDAVVCYSVDRLSRSQIHLGLLLSEAERDGVTLVFVTEPLEHTAVGIFLQQARAFAAELEREKIRERSMRGKAERHRSGRLAMGGPDLYGYRTDRERGVRIVHEPEAAIVREIFGWIAGGASIHEAVRRLTIAGVPSPSTNKITWGERGSGRFAHRWGTAQIRRMLANPAYKGEAYARRFTADHNKAGRAPMRPVEEWQSIPGATTPAIVPADLWSRARDAVARSRGDNTRNIARPALLRGHIYCAVCGRRMSPESERGGRYPIYRCTSRASPGGACGGARVRADIIEPLVWRRVARILADPRLIRAGRERGRKRGAGHDDAAVRAEAARKVAEIERRQGRILARYGDATDDTFPWHVAEAQVAQLQRDRAHWQGILDKAREEIREEDALPIAIAALADHVPGIAAMDFDAKRLALSVLGIRVIAQGREWRMEIDPRG